MHKHSVPPLVKQGFPNSVKGLGGSEIWLGIFFYWVVGTWGAVILTIWTFFKAKTTFCKYWISLKIKISMTLCVQRVYMKFKKVQEQWLQLKMKFLLDTNMKNCYLTGEFNLWWEESYRWKFSRWRDKHIYSLCSQQNLYCSIV